MIAIDLGSNTIRFIEYDGEYWGNSYEKIVKTAESLHETKRIGENALERILSAINEAKTKLDFVSNDIIGCATAAMRMAENSDSVIESIEAATGIRFTIIDAEKEANLTLNAVRYRLSKLGIEPSSFVMADIGGGSTELIVCEGQSSRSISFNIGIVTLSERSNTPKKLDESIYSFKEQINSQRFPHTSLVLTAGTPTTIAAYLNGMDYETYDPEKINGYRLHLEDCYRVEDDLLKMDEVTRARYVGVGRENLIIAGIRMVTAIFEALDYNEAIIIDDGLREGIALEYFC
ncbi:phosphatase [Sulfuricurvum sp.]|uniref:Ppx/GppA phosphatase family protein n=1 Tax=Sulfuricurvum sp. TaxID=2025608 RepID=UPI0026108A41|nr:phosphatase [Sulfuricurvum sp.]MDD2267352.1 phosphatase [Sulfuricurvum sp.]MDD2784654.1 phosphatase [Sulfuricurvum sp.]